MARLFLPRCADVCLEQFAQDVVYYPSRADIWSLGIILLNMVTGRRPWKAARVSDVNFRAFLDDEDYLYHTFPISRSLNEVLKWILCPKPLARLQILQIRESILNMDTFFRVPWLSYNATLRQSGERILIQYVQKQIFLSFGRSRLGWQGEAPRRLCRSGRPA